MSQVLQTRKTPRLKHHDYKRDGIYFVTICTHEREPILGKVIFNTDDNRNIAINVTNGSIPSQNEYVSKPNVFITPATVKLTAIGKFVLQTIESIANRYPGVEINKYIVMPNHIHLLIMLKQEQQRQGTRCRSGEAEQVISQIVSLSEIVRWLKIVTSKKYGKALWQRSYHDHIIRGEHDYRKIWQYIDENSQRWMFDKYYKK